MMWRHLLAVVFAGELSLGSVHAQSVTGRISGTVRDSSNAVVPGASVTVTNQATQIARTARTDDEGFYVVTNLPPGDYVVGVELSGFKTFETSGNVLVADGRLTIDPTLEAGRVSETVTVTAQAGETDAAHVRPYLAEAHWYLAKAYLRRHEIRAAERQLKNVIQLDESRAGEAPTTAYRAREVQNSTRLDIR